MSRSPDLQEVFDASMMRTRPSDLL